MKEKLSKDGLAFLYLLLRAVEEHLVNTTFSSWEEDVFGKKLINMQKVRKIRKEIEEMLGREFASELNRKILQIKYHPYLATVDEKVYSVIERAFEQRRRLAIEYFSLKKADTVRRKIDIYYKSHRYIIAFCHLRNAIRKFRTARIVSAKLMPEHYEIPEDFDKNNYL